jgi:hypothetical protein
MSTSSCSSSSSSSNTVSTKSRKSNGKCCPPSPCDVKCCLPDKCLDCCTPAYQRLDKLRKAWSTIAATGGLTNFLPLASDDCVVINNVATRGGASIDVPTGSLFEQGSSSPSDNNGIEIANCATSGAGIQVELDNAYYAYLFVNTHRYLNFESCGKLDQVVGWLVDTSVGQLELFQSLPDLNLLVSDNRQWLLDQAVANLSSTGKAKLYALNVLYKVSLKAIEAVSQNPKEEGNIVAVTDKCGQKWLVAINRANGDQSVCDVNTQYAVVAIPLC